MTNALLYRLFPYTAVADLYIVCSFTNAINKLTTSIGLTVPLDVRYINIIFTILKKINVCFVTDQMTVNDFRQVESQNLSVLKKKGLYTTHVIRFIG